MIIAEVEVVNDLTIETGKKLFSFVNKFLSKACNLHIRTELFCFSCITICRH